MASYTVRKIKEIPFRINHEIDEVIEENLTRTQFEELLDDMGYDLNKFTQVDNITVYYKNRKNGLYITYIHNNHSE